MTELKSKAAGAWAQMIRREHPVPAAVAIDMVRDVCGDRDGAVMALCAAAADWLAYPTGGDPANTRDSADLVCGYLRAEMTGMATVFLGHVSEPNYRLRLSRVLHPRAVSERDAQLARDWGRWCEDAGRAIRLVDELAAAAHPA